MANKVRGYVAAILVLGGIGSHFWFRSASGHSIEEVFFGLGALPFFAILLAASS